ncbi:hypothetical protein [Idiomarina aminovorans]|uniref:hypothetical protein n=1 Tax=Idiomarina aminovorans TaxID=2914829 RepID=UPI00200401FC|nr:hypothetical protein [Idiomarina sp. ATCH4]
MKWFLLLSAFSLLIGCSSPTVFLTTERLSQYDREKLITALSDNGFKVKTTSGVMIPEAFPDVVVATNPANENLKFFNQLEQVIRQQKLGSISYQKLYQQKHYYKGRNVGLYVRGNAPELKLPPVLRGNAQTCNNQRMILEFKSNKRLNIDVEAEKITSYTGSYKSVLPDTIYANFESLESPVTLRLAKVSVKTYAGMKTADKIVVTKSSNKMLTEGCEFMIIHY